MTCEGGGAVAFPVMTLALHVAPSVARDFAMMIQSCGMSAATFTIFFMKIKCDWSAAGLATAGGLGGLILGLELIDPVLTAQTKKMIFVSVWFSFAGVLCFVNFFRKRSLSRKIDGN